MSQPRRRWTFTGRPLRRGLLRNRDGSAAVEFAMMALPFFFMLFAILEVALIFTLDALLETATLDVGRLVRTGQASAQGLTPAEFKARMCSRMSVFSGACATHASIDVRVVTSFSTPPQDPVVDGTTPSFDTGQPGNLMLVRVWYPHPLQTGFLAQALSRSSTGEAVLTSATAFKNEPPGGGGPAPATPPATP